MRQADELVIILRIGTESADGDCHAAFEIAVELRLRAVGFFKVVQELLRRDGRFSSCALPEKAAQSALICSMDGFSPLKETKQAAICPSEQGTRRHCAVMFGSAALTI